MEKILNFKNERYLSEIFRDDEGIVLKAIEYNAISVIYASDRLQNNKNFIDKALRTNKYVFSYLSDQFKNHKEIVLKLVQNDGLFLRYVPEKLQNDKFKIYNQYINLLSRTAWEDYTIPDIRF